MPVVPGGALRFDALPGRASADPLPAGFTDRCAARVVRIAGDTARTAHRHPHSVEVVYVVSGDGLAWEDGTATPVAAGDLIAVPRGVPHATVATSPAGLTLVCFFPHGDLRENLEELDIVVGI